MESALASVAIGAAAVIPIAATAAVIRDNGGETPLVLIIAGLMLLPGLPAWVILLILAGAAEPEGEEPRRKRG